MDLALTFDDGPSEWTVPILDLLAEHGCRATFFVTGGNIRTAQDAAIVARITSDGHQVGNHTMTHPDLSTLGYDEARHELGCANLMIAATSDQMPDVYRPPYLRLNQQAAQAASDLTLTAVGCDVVAGDWATNDPEQIMAYVIQETRDGSIILLHDGRPFNQPTFADGGSLDSREHTVEALSLILPALIGRGFSFATASELLH